MREVKKSVWVDFVMKKIATTDEYRKTCLDIEDATIHVLDDLRFRDELLIVKKYQKCISIRLTRDDSLNIEDPSEKDLDNEAFDYYIENNGTQERLNEKVKEILKIEGII